MQLKNAQRLIVSLLTILLAGCTSDITNDQSAQDDGTGSSGGSSGSSSSGGSSGGTLLSCLGVPPSHASLCPSDDRNLTSSEDMTTVSACTDSQKCEYQCDAGYVVDNGSCALDPNATNICEATGGARCFYLAPNGSDANSGSITSPFASTNPIINSLLPGDFVYFRGGTYGERAKGQRLDYGSPLPDYPSVAYLKQRSGAPGRPITFKAYPGELPVLDLYNINPEYDPTSIEDGVNDAFFLLASDHVVISGLELVHGSITVRNSDYTWIENNHIHDVLSNRDNNGLVILYFTQHAYVRNNDLHDVYSRKISDGSGGFILNTVRSHEDAAHNGCISTLSGDSYVGYGNETSGPFEFTDNDLHDCPVHLFIKNVQGEMVNEDGVNILVKDNLFHGGGRLGINFNAANVLFENNLFKDIEGISQLGSSGTKYNDPSTPTILNEINARNVTFRHNVFSSLSSVILMNSQGYLLENGVYSTALEDKFKFYDNVVLIDDASPAGTMISNQGGFVFGNTGIGMIDTVSTPPSKTLSRIDSSNNCFINQQGTNLAFTRHIVSHWEGDIIRPDSWTGCSPAESRTRYNINGAGDLFPSDTSPATHFANPATNDYSVKATSPCAAIPGVGLLNPARFRR